MCDLVVLILHDILLVQDLQIYKDIKESDPVGTHKLHVGSDHVKENSLYTAVSHTQ